MSEQTRKTLKDITEDQMVAALKAYEAEIENIGIDTWRLPYLADMRDRIAFELYRRRNCPDEPVVVEWEEGPRCQN